MKLKKLVRYEQPFWLDCQWNQNYPENSRFVTSSIDNYYLLYIHAHTKENSF